MQTSLDQLVARIKIRMRHELDFCVNTQRFFADQAYASQVLMQAENSSRPELRTTALELRDKLGWLQASATPVPTQSAMPRSQARTPVAIPVERRANPRRPAIDLQRYQLAASPVR